MEDQFYIHRIMCQKFDWCMKFHTGPIFIVDTETTGPNPYKDEIVQISALMLCRDQHGQYRIAKYFDQYIRSTIPVSAGASAVSHITNEMLQGQPTMNDTFPNILRFFGDLENVVVMGYCNSKFDNILLKRLYESYGYTFSPAMSIDVKQMAEELVDRKEVPEQKLTLQNVANLYGVQTDGLHNALMDIYVTGNTAFRMYDDYLTNHLAALNQYVNKPNITITSLYRFKKSKTVDFLYITGTVVDNNGFVHAGKIRYSIWFKRYENVEGELFEYGNLDNLDNQIQTLAGGNIAKYMSPSCK